MVAARTLHNQSCCSWSLCTLAPGLSLFRRLDDLGANYSLVPSGRVHVLLFLDWSMAGLFILLHPIPSFGLETPHSSHLWAGPWSQTLFWYFLFIAERAQCWLSCPTTLNPRLFSTCLLMVIESSLFSLLFFCNCLLSLSFDLISDLVTATLRFKQFALYTVFCRIARNELDPWKDSSSFPAS